MGGGGGVKTVRESVIRTVCGSELQTDGAENRKARLEKSVLLNGWSSSGISLQFRLGPSETDERKVRLQTCFRDSVVQVNWVDVSCYCLFNRPIFPDITPV